MTNKTSQNLLQPIPQKKNTVAEEESDDETFYTANDTYNRDNTLLKQEELKIK